MSDISIDVPVPVPLFFEMQSYATQHNMMIEDVVARAWTLYRDMSAMRDEPLLEPCPYCSQLHTKGTVEQCPMKQIL